MRMRRRTTGGPRTECVTSHGSDSGSWTVRLAREALGLGFGRLLVRSVYWRKSSIARVIVIVTALPYG